MATEGGADLLREVIANVWDRQNVRCTGDDDGNWEAVVWPGSTAAEAILGAIAEAGWVVVEKDRLERLTNLADLGNEYCHSNTGEWWGKAEPPRPGDLDGPGGGEG